MFIVTVLLFLLPSSLLWAARRRYSQSKIETPTPNWRKYSSIAALILAVCSMLLELVFFYSWFRNGGSPHGLMPSRGIWKSVGPLSFWALVASLSLSVLGKGRWRLLMPAWAAACLFVDYLIFMLEMD